MGVEARVGVKAEPGEGVNRLGVETAFGLCPNLAGQAVAAEALAAIAEPGLFGITSFWA